MEDFCDAEVERAFRAIDIDGNGAIDKEEAQQLLEDVYVGAYGRQIETQRNKFFGGFSGDRGMSREKLAANLAVLQRELEGRGGAAAAGGDGDAAPAEFEPPLARSLADALGLRACSSPSTWPHTDSRSWSTAGTSPALGRA